MKFGLQTDSRISTWTCSCDPVKITKKIFCRTALKFEKTFILTVIGAQNVIHDVMRPTEKNFEKNSFFRWGRWCGIVGFFLSLSGIAARRYPFRTFSHVLSR